VTKAKSRRIMRLSRLVCLLFGWMVRVTLHDAHNLPAGGAVVVSNHRSVADGPLLWLAITRQRRQVVFMATRGVFRIPLLGPLLLWMGFIPVHRGDTRTANTGQIALDGAAAAVKDGRLLGMYPRGGISTAAKPRRMKRGVARLYAMGFPIVPVVSRGAERLLPPQGWTKWFPRPWRKIHLHIHPPLPSGLTPQEVLDQLDHTLYGSA
jgi:1-acyl-sn-glycerol-3-phosphate acyltransferase